jgi:hypothetical protein
MGGGRPVLAYLQNVTRPGPCWSDLHPPPIVSIINATTTAWKITKISRRRKVGEEEAAEYWRAGAVHGVSCEATLWQAQGRLLASQPLWP